MFAQIKSLKTCVGQLIHVGFVQGILNCSVHSFHAFLRATTHTDLVLRAHQLNIPYQVIHNASIMNAVGCCGLQVELALSSI